MSTSRREWLFSLFIAGICIGLAFIDLAGIPPAPGGHRSRALITAVDNSRVKTHLIVKTNAQFLTVKLLEGPYKGQELPVANMLTGKMELDEFYEEGSVILVEYHDRDGKPSDAITKKGGKMVRKAMVTTGIALFAMTCLGVSQGYGAYGSLFSLGIRGAPSC